MGKVQELAADFAAAGGAVTIWAWPALPDVAARLRDGYDALLQCWQLAWIRHALLSAPRHVLDANGFAPLPSALAYSDPLLGYGALSLLFAPFPPVLAFNLTWLVALAVSLLAVARLARWLGASRPAAVLGAAAACLGARAATDLGYVPFTAFGGIALLVLAWRRLAASRRGRDAILLGLAAGGLGLFSLQLLAFGLVGLALLAAVDLARCRSRARLAALAGASGLVAAAMVLPVGLALARVKRAEGWAHPADEARRYSAAPADWVTTSALVPGQRFLGRFRDSETSLYPGSVALALALVALAAWRRRRSGLLVPGAVLAAAGVIFSFGPRGPGWLLLHGPAAPVFGSVRAYARFSFVAMVGFALLAAAGLDLLLAATRRAPVRAAGIAAAALLVFADVRNVVRLGFSPEPRSAADRLADRLPAPTLHLPLTGRASDARWLFASVPRFRPVVDGYASVIPAAHRALAAELAAPDGRTLDRLRAWPVGTVVVHEHLLALPALAPTLRMVAGGLREGRLGLVGSVPHAGGIDDLLVFGPNRRDASELLARAEAAADVTPAREADFPSSIDDPPEGIAARGTLLVRGWSQTEAGPSRVVDVTIDGGRRLPLSRRRAPRADVCAAFPRFGDCARAGYELRFPFLPGDAGAHEVRVVVLTPDGRLRTLARRFAWAP